MDPDKITQMSTEEIHNRLYQNRNVLAELGGWLYRGIVEDEIIALEEELKRRKVNVSAQN